ncbi:DUF7144 family membrane protein [Nakamurella lactea]|uniref:DUF7144 family membrane protein n=1 Tax=Nakamurella lactea TaxID=459515 RepID=UPI00040397EF|nr:hypothetical protein [Nakamurella lactea]
MTQSNPSPGVGDAPPEQGSPPTQRRVAVEPELGAGKRAVIIGVTAVGAIFLLLAGVLQFLQGLAALIKGDFFVVARNFTYTFNVTTWGWIHFVIGVLMVITGFALVIGAMWARVVGIGLALFSAMANFMFLPYYPAWAIIIIILDVALIWALANYDRAID